MRHVFLVSTQKSLEKFLSPPLSMPTTLLFSMRKLDRFGSITVDLGHELPEV